MSKTLYEEALADVRQLRDVAESNAKRSIMEQVTPRIKELIEQQLLGEHDEGDGKEVLTDEGDEEMDEACGASGVAGSMVSATGSETAKGDTTPVDEGDAEDVDEGGVFVMSNEGIETLTSLVSPMMSDKIEVGVYRLAEETNELVTAGAKLRASSGYVSKIDETIHRVEDMYQYVQGSSDSSRKSALEGKLERCFEILSAIKESIMRTKGLTEDKEVTLKLTGLPDDVELDNLNIDLISDEDEEAGTEDVAAGGEMPPADDVGGVGEEPVPSEGVDMMGELDEDEVVEISESMLRSEIARMKKLTEDNDKSADDGEPMGSEDLDDFGGGKDEGEPFLDGEVTTADNQSVNEADGDDDEDDKVEEGDIQGKMDDDHVSEADMYESAKQEFETLKRVYESSKGGSKVAAKKLALEAHKRMVGAKAKLVEAKKVSKKSSNKTSAQLTETKAAVESLRKQLTETNLLNAKLIHANKLLQNEGLSAKQKATVIDKLDEAQNLREVKLVYNSLVKAFADKKVVKEATEGRKVLGSSSAPTRTGSAPTVTTEGIEAARWAKLAGISK